MNRQVITVEGFGDVTIADSEYAKVIRSENYNMGFNKITGYMARWGKTHDDDPDYGPGPELLDIEISVNDCPNNCRFCYKGNTSEPGRHMSLETFKRVMQGMPKTVTQIAFGITGLKANPDFIPILKHCRDLGIVPNFTLSGVGLDEDFAHQVVPLVGAVAVSAYESDKNVCYNAVEMLSHIDQTNIHLLICKETMPFVEEVLEDICHDQRLAKLRAVVFLCLKPKGRAAGRFHQPSQADYDKVINYCLERDIRFGFDSCGAPKFEESVIASKALKAHQKQQLIQCSERCESFGMFSAYINVDGKYYPCSFCEDEPGWEDGLEFDNFLTDVWLSDKVKAWRDKALSAKRECVMFDL